MTSKQRNKTWAKRLAAFERDASLFEARYFRSIGQNRLARDAERWARKFDRMAD